MHIPEALIRYILAVNKSGRTIFRQIVHLKSGLGAIAPPVTVGFENFKMFTGILVLW